VKPRKGAARATPAKKRAQPAASRATPTRKRTEPAASRARSGASPRAEASKTTQGAQPSLAAAVQAALKSLERRGTKRTLDGMARYGIVASKAFGVSIGDVQRIGNALGRSHDLAAAL